MAAHPGQRLACLFYRSMSYWRIRPTWPLIQENAWPVYFTGPCHTGGYVQHGRSSRTTPGLSILQVHVILEDTSNMAAHPGQRLACLFYRSMSYWRIRPTWPLIQENAWPVYFTGPCHTGGYVQHGRSSRKTPGLSILQVHVILEDTSNMAAHPGQCMACLFYRSMSYWRIRPTWPLIQDNAWPVYFTGPCPTGGYVQHGRSSRTMPGLSILQVHVLLEDTSNMAAHPGRRSIAETRSAVTFD